MRRVVGSIWVAVALACTPAVVRAQGFLTPAPRPQPKDSGRSGVPRDQLPPPGMCRIWLDGVPAGQQPAPTDCASAVRNRPPNGRVIFNDPRDSDRGRTPVKKDDEPKAPPPKPKKPDAWE